MKRGKITGVSGGESVALEDGVGHVEPVESSHWNECWRVHPRCRMELAARLLAEGRQVLDGLSGIVRDMERELRGMR